MPPVFDVEKNSGSIKSKSFSCDIRSIRTEPTMPRQPTKPTSLLISMPFQFTNSVNCSPGSSGQEGRTTNQAGSARNRYLVDGDCARARNSRVGNGAIYGVSAANKHAVDCSGRGLSSARLLRGKPFGVDATALPRLLGLGQRRSLRVNERDWRACASPEKGFT